MPNEGDAIIHFCEGSTAPRVYVAQMIKLPTQLLRVRLKDLIPLSSLTSTNATWFVSELNALMQCVGAEKELNTESGIVVVSWISFVRGIT